MPPSGYIFLKCVYKQNFPAQAPVFYVVIDKEAHVGKWTCCSKTGSQKAGWCMGWQHLCKLRKMGNKMWFIVCYVSFNYEPSANAWQRLKTKNSNKVISLKLANNSICSVLWRNRRRDFWTSHWAKDFREVWLFPWLYCEWHIREINGANEETEKGMFYAGCRSVLLDTTESGMKDLFSFCLC